MKQKTNVLTFIILLLGIMLHTSCKEVENIGIFSDDAQLSTRSNGVTAVWDYPLKPGMEKWSLLKTEWERIFAVQVPEDILGQLSAEDAVYLCITFPRFGYFGAFNTPQEGFSIMLSEFNIFRHLLSRNDVGRELIKAYKDAGMAGFKTLPYSNEFWPIKLYYLELILSQREILQSLTLEEKRELLFEARRKCSEKVVTEGFASLLGVLFSVRIMASILDMEAHPEFLASSNRDATTQLIQTGRVSGTVPPIDEIIKITDKYLYPNY